MRIKRGTTHVRRRNTLQSRTKGFKWGRKKTLRGGKTAILKAGAHAYRHRRERKQEFRRLWQIRVNAGARANGLPYSRLVHALKLAKVDLNRKMLADLAANEPEMFAAIVKQVTKDTK